MKMSIPSPFLRVLVLLLVVAPAVLAQRDDSAEARFERGKKAFDRMEVEGAREELEAALAVTEGPLAAPRKLEAERLLGLIAQYAQRTADAVTWNTRALATLTGIEGVKSPALVPLLVELARSLKDDGQLPESLAPLERALVLLAPAAETEGERIAAIRFDLARSAKLAGRRELALDNFLLYLAAREKALGPDSGDLAYPLEQIAALQIGLGRKKDALATWERWMALFEKLKGPKSPALCRGLDATSRLRIALGDADGAEKDVQRWLSLLLKVTVEHPEIATAEHRFSMLEDARGNHEEALRHLDAALLQTRKIRGPGALAFGKFQLDRADLLRRMKRLDEALAAAETGCAILVKKRAGDDVEVVLGFLERGRVHLDREEWDLAAADFRRVTGSWERIGGPKHPALAEPLGFLATALEKKGGEEAAKEAAALRGRVKEIEAAAR
ncbi:MAG: tetratricopeptide repeat protein [Planctomycetota bacterium]